MADTALGNWVRARPERVSVVAGKMGVGRIALHRYMAGSVMPRPGVVKRIEEATGGAVTAADLNRDYRG